MTCIPLDDPDNGASSCTGSVYEDTCSFTCDDGYELTGSDTRTCQSDGNWSGTETMCIPGKAEYKVDSLEQQVHTKLVY